jgi:hypothetical protein
MGITGKTRTAKNIMIKEVGWWVWKWIAHACDFGVRTVSSAANGIISNAGINILTRYY